MRKDITIVAEPRATRGKNEAYRLRTRGMIPAVLYGNGKNSIAISISPKELGRILRSSTGHNTIFNLSLDGEVTPVMVIDEQYEPVKDTLLHADLTRIDLSKRRRARIPVHTVGEAPGVKQQGGLLEIVHRAVEIECLPDDIPERFDLDVSKLGVNEGIRASDVALSGSMKLVSDPTEILVHVTGRVAEETTTAAGGEPEVAAKGKAKKEAAGKAPAAKK